MAGIQPSPATVSAPTVNGPTASPFARLTPFRIRLSLDDATTVRVEATGATGRVTTTMPRPLLPHSLDERDSDSWSVARRTGLALYRVAFPPGVVALIGEHRATQSSPVSILLDLASPELVDLPWELVRDPAVDQFLGLSRESPISRSVDGLAHTMPTPQDRQLSVVVSGSRDEDDALRQTLDVLPHVKIMTSNSAEPAGNVDVIHVESFGIDDGTSMSAPVVIVPGTAGDAVRAATRPGVTAGIAVPVDLPQETRSLFLEGLYRGLSSGLPIDQAFTDARRAVASARSLANLEWANRR